MRNLISIMWNNAKNHTRFLNFYGRRLMVRGWRDKKLGALTTMLRAKHFDAAFPNNPWKMMRETRRDIRFAYSKYTSDDTDEARRYKAILKRYNELTNSVLLEHEHGQRNMMLPELTAQLDVVADSPADYGLPVYVDLLTKTQQVHKMRSSEYLRRWAAALRTLDDREPWSKEDAQLNPYDAEKLLLEANVTEAQQQEVPIEVAAKAGNEPAVVIQPLLVGETSFGEDILGGKSAVSDIRLSVSLTASMIVNCADAHDTERICDALTMLDLGGIHATYSAPNILNLTVDASKHTPTSAFHEIGIEDNRDALEQQYAVMRKALDAVKALATVVCLGVEVGA